MRRMPDPFVVARPGATGYEPFIHQDVPTGEFRQVAIADGQGVLEAGYWRSEPATYAYVFETDETFVVLDGAATIALDTGETVEVKAGDMAYFVAGTRSTWTITEPFRKFVVVPA
jgi:uncharacterized cupin superfamily protein